MLSKRANVAPHRFLFQVVHLGVALSEVEDGSQRVVLYYTDPGRGRTQEAASFKMADLTGRWARFTLTVQGAEVGGRRRIFPLMPSPGRPWRLGR